VTKRAIKAADHYCGGGGTSTGLVEACKELGIEVDLLAINHWQVAIDTHTKAHPWARHMCNSLTAIKPREAIPGGRLHVLVASPECTNHSTAKGGRPKDEQSRATAWDVLKWLQELYVDNLLLENVKEFRKWGPLGANGKPLKSRQGETYKAFLAVIRAMGYNIEDRVLNAADYGAPTSRERLFIVARRNGKKIVWPEPTHSRTGAVELFSAKKRYRAAREIIDFSIPNPSIFSRRKPLAENTLSRIFAGMEKINPHLAPFIVTLRNHVAARDLDEPLPTITAGGTHLGLCEPFVLGQQSCSAARSLDERIPTVATAGAISLVEPVLLKVTHGAEDDGRPRSLDNPLPTLTTKNGIGLAEGFIVPFFGERDGQKPRSHSLDDPLPCVTSHGAGGLVEPYLTKYYGTGGAASLDEPLDTVTTKDRFGLVQPEWNGYRLDIRFRMLQPHELAAASTFPKSYPFTGTKSEVVKQIGNAVPPMMAKALLVELLRDYASATKRGSAEVIAMPPIAEHAAKEATA
jgi:DNA (cytosine-5)-methyltransferase 1